MLQDPFKAKHAFIVRRGGEARESSETVKTYIYHPTGGEARKSRETVKAYIHWQCVLQVHPKHRIQELLHLKPKQIATHSRTMLTKDRLTEPHWG